MTIPGTTGRAIGYSLLVLMIAIATGADEESPAKTEEARPSLKAELAAGHRVGIWVPYWTTGVQDEEAGVLLSLAGTDGKLSIGRSDRGPELELKPLPGRTLTIADLEALDRWLLRHVDPASGAKKGDRMLIRNSGDNGQDRDLQLLSTDEGWDKEGLLPGELNPGKLVAEAWQEDVKRERENPAPVDFRAETARFHAADPLRKDFSNLREKVEATREDERETERLIGILWPLHEAYRRVEADAICHAERIQLLHIQCAQQQKDDGDGGKEAIDGYPILAQHDIPLTEAMPLLAGLRETLGAGHSNWMTMCYIPHHAMRIWDRNGELICQGTICTHCNQCRLEGPQGAKFSSGGVTAGLRRALKEWDEKDGFAEQKATNSEAVKDPAR
jgi:hypothetical protein